MPRRTAGAGGATAPPGIALAFLKLHEKTSSDEYAGTARRALLVHPRDLRYSNLSQCHGLSGLGEVYLEAARVLGDGEWRARAQEIAMVLYHLRRTGRYGGLTWLVEDPAVATADLMVGSAGVVHFFAHLALSEDGFGMPLAPEVRL